MGFFWNKKIEEKKTRVDKEEKDDGSVRIDVEDMIDQNYTCEEIAQELSINKEKVYRIKEAKKRRETRVKTNAVTSNTPTDPIQEIKLDIAKMELEQKKKEIQWKNEDLDRQRKESLIDDVEEMVEEVEEGSEDDNLFDRLLQLASMIQSKNPVPVQQTTSPTVSAVAVSPPAVETEVKGLLTDEQVLQNAELVKSKIPKAFWNVVKGQLGQFTDTDVIRIKNKLLELQ